jgi:hypothetical protein
MNRLVVEVYQNQLRSLKWIYAIIFMCVLGICAVTIVLGPPLVAIVQASTLLVVELILGGLAAGLIFVVVPLSRKKLCSPDRVRTAAPEQLQSWGLPADIDQVIGRQAVFLTRYTAGCVISWGLSASVGLYGLITRMLGSPAAISGIFLALAVFFLMLLPPRGQWLKEKLQVL